MLQATTRKPDVVDGGVCVKQHQKATWLIRIHHKQPKKADSTMLICLTATQTSMACVWWENNAAKQEKEDREREKREREEQLTETAACPRPQRLRERTTGDLKAILASDFVVFAISKLPTQACPLRTTRPSYCHGSSDQGHAHLFPLLYLSPTLYSGCPIAESTRGRLAAPHEYRTAHLRVRAPRL